MTLASDAEPGATVDRLYLELRRAIIRCELEPDSIVSQVRLAERFGVSRTPLREVLRLLERDGLVESRHNKRVRISGFSLRDFEEVSAQRVVLETMAARNAVRTLTPATIDKMETDLEVMRSAAEANNLEEWRGAHESFHHHLTSSAGPRIERSINELGDLSDRYRAIYASQAPLAWKRGLRHHEAILAAVRTFDADAVGVKVGEHLAVAATALIAMVDADHEPVLVNQALALVVPSGDRAAP
ncbi:GntR family transcriptional regulator [Nocardia sp. NPDC050799]|uniref:GntR family transcriptional regulator n=1 Tax=Nocardia sp. NPDC050799 TaxID=3154842 RepID=UPI003404BA8F